MRYYLWHKRLQEMYLVVSKGVLKIGNSGWKEGITYRKLSDDSHEPVPFTRTIEEIKERFITLETLELEHDLVSLDIMYDPMFPIERATVNSIGIDVRTTIPFSLKPGERQKIPTGVFWNVRSVDPDYSAELQVRARSGNAHKLGAAMINGVGTIDEDYRGEIHALIVNHGAVEISMEAGDKVAQIILSMSPNPSGLESITKEKVRGTLGFGSTDSPSENAPQEGKRNTDLYYKVLGMLKLGHDSLTVVKALLGTCNLPASEVHSLVCEAQRDLLNK